TRIADLRDIIGHVQFASVPDRGAPDHGELNYAHIFAALADWPTPLGAEYKPGGDTDATLGWLAQFRG
ncbi:MAG: isomerase, partial [Pseudomonadota bacterium]